ncbi:MAG: TlpA disulfide reductase family protein [Planctomycetota bacterium]|nr:TlpA disulfide reductase family protein [Planctomycetota bacterium]
MSILRPSKRTNSQRSLILMLAGVVHCAMIVNSDVQASPQNPAFKPPATSSSAGEFPDEWYFYGSNRPQRFRAMEGKPAPEITTSFWYEDEYDLEQLKGKVVVVDFWATWCGPCVRALPKNVKMAKKYKDEDFVLLGIHDVKRGWDRIEQFATKNRINYPLARDDGSSARRWGVSFWPTYAVIDREGIVRAIGLTPDSIERVVKRVIEGGPVDPDRSNPPQEEVKGPEVTIDTTKEKTSNSGNSRAAQGPGSANPNSQPGIKLWPILEGNEKSRQRLTSLMELDTPPPLSTSDWMNSETLKLDELQGKVIVLDFWATWCPPCIRGVPKMNELYAQHKDEGLVIIGLCHPRGIDRMGTIVEESGITYPVCQDLDGKTRASYLVNGFPDYYLIDRSGKLRYADLANKTLEAAVELLMNEEAPANEDS